MKKKIKIDGMSCAHCSSRVEKALGALSGVKAVVDLEKGMATVEYEGAISDQQLRETVEELGFACLAIE